MKTFQSTLPREERRKSTRANRSSVKISIHASTRGATDSDLSECFKIHISIHASTRGATQFLSLVSSRLQISIHASTRGATLMFGFLTPYFIFQSTLPREERPSSSCVVHPTTLFQSTLPREERPIRCRFLHAIENFNPRFHERSDNQP